MVALVPVLCAIAGALVYGLSNNPKVSSLGRDVFVCAFLVCMLVAAGLTVRLL